jgi:hypothetical protein
VENKHLKLERQILKELAVFFVKEELSGIA